MSDYYRGKRAWVVGGSQGIGLALAQGLHRRGTQITLLARQEERLRQVAPPLQARVAPLDVSDPHQVERVFGECLKAQGAPDFLFNCAGLALPGYLEDLSLEDIQRMNAVNYLGTVYCCQAVLPALLQQKRGHILNISSLGGVMGLFGYTAYCGSKFAVMGFSEALRREVQGQGIRVSCCCPPNTRTPGLEQENLRKPPEVLAQEEKVQVLDPEVVAEAVLKRLPSHPRVIIPSLDGQLAHALARWAPWLLDRFLRRPPVPPPQKG